MEELTKVETLIGYVKEYAETKFDLVVLNIQDKVTDIVASTVSSLIATILIVFIVLFASIGCALWLGNYFQNSFMGFFCISGFYLVVALIVILNRSKWIKSPLINALIKKINFHEEN